MGFVIVMLLLLRLSLCLISLIVPLPKRLIGVFEIVYEADSSPSLKLGPRWKDIILDPNLTNLYYDVSYNSIVICVKVAIIIV